MIILFWNKARNFHIYAYRDIGDELVTLSNEIYAILRHLCETAFYGNVEFIPSKTKLLSVYFICVFLSDFICGERRSEVCCKSECCSGEGCKCCEGVQVKSRLLVSCGQLCLQRMFLHILQELLFSVKLIWTKLYAYLFRNCYRNLICLI